MIYLGSLPVICDIFAVVVFCVWLFAHVDHLVDRLLAQLHPLRLGGRRTSGVILFSGVRLPLHPRSFVSGSHPKSRH